MVEIEYGTLGELHPNTARRFRDQYLDEVNDSTRVLIARKGGKIVGDAVVLNGTCPFGGRALYILSSTDLPEVKDLLVQEAKAATRHLKRYTRCLA